MLKVLYIMPPTTIVSGGAAILDKVADSLSEKFLVTRAHILLYDKRRSSDLLYNWRFIKKVAKVVLSKLRHRDNIAIVRRANADGYDLYFAGWAGDLADILNLGIDPKKVYHICQSIESWGVQWQDASVAYGTPVHRWFVSKWLMQYLKQYCLTSAYIGVYVNDIFLSDYPVSKQNIVSSLLHPGWWKNPTENILASSWIAKKYALTFVPIVSGFLPGAPRGLKNCSAHQVREHLARSDIFVSLSFYEGLPILVLEAAAMGCFLVLSDIPAHREILDYLRPVHHGILTAGNPFEGEELIDETKPRVRDAYAAREIVGRNFSYAVFKARVACAIDALGPVLRKPPAFDMTYENVTRPS